MVTERLMWAVARETPFLWISWVPRYSHPGLVGKTHRDQTKRLSFFSNQDVKRALDKSRIKNMDGN